MDLHHYHTEAVSITVPCAQFANKLDLLWGNSGDCRCKKTPQQPTETVKQGRVEWKGREGRKRCPLLSLKALMCLYFLIFKCKPFCWVHN